jgi:hypothetical protein
VTIFRNKGNGQTNGADVSTTNSATSGDALTTVTKTGTSTIKYDTTSPPFTGCAWFSCVPQAGFVAQFDVIITSSNDTTWETLFDYTAAPTVANTGIIGFRTSANVRIGELVMGTNGKPNFQASGGGTLASYTGTALTVGRKRVRVKLHTDTATPANGTISYSIYNDATGVLEATMSGTGTINGGQIGIIRHGCTSTSWSVAGNWTAWRYGLLQWSDTNADIGPFPTSTASASAGPDWLIDAFQGWQTGDALTSRATLDGSASTYTGTGSPVFAWTGPAGVTFSDSTAQITQAILPCSLTDQTYTLTLTVTMDVAVSSDTANVTVKAAEEAQASGGVWKPSRTVWL